MKIEIPNHTRLCLCVSSEVRSFYHYKDSYGPVSKPNPGHNNTANYTLDDFQNLWRYIFNANQKM